MMFMTDVLPESEGPPSQKTCVKDRQRSFWESATSSLIVLIARHMFYPIMGELSVSRFDASQDVKPIRRRLTKNRTVIDQKIQHVSLRLSERGWGTACEPLNPAARRPSGRYRRTR